jgi:hypothetical protein
MHSRPEAAECFSAALTGHLSVTWLQVDVYDGAVHVWRSWHMGMTVQFDVATAT